jgi:hypothetical protein
MSPLDLSPPWVTAAGHGAPEIVERSAASVTFVGGKSECDDAHLVVPLGETFTCDEAVIAFDYAIKSVPGEEYARTPAVMIQLCKGASCESGAFYATEENGAAYTRCVGGDGPVVGLLGARSFSVRAAALTPAFDGTCKAPFDTVDIHVMDSDAPVSGKSVPRTLSNVRVLRTTAPRPQAPACSKHARTHGGDLPPPVEPQPPSSSSDGEPRPPQGWVGSMATGYRDCSGPDEDDSAFSDFSWAPDAHLAYGIGGATGARSGFRQGVDLTAGVWAQAKERALVLTGSFVTGFGAYPTYAGIDIGYGRYAPIIAGWTATIGPAMRIDPNVAFGGEARLEGIFFFFHGGVRAIAIAGSESELQVTGFIGPGF